MNYAPNWSTISRRTRNMTANRCANCWHRQATETHHMMYIDLLGAIAGREIPGWHVVPLCQTCHDCKHRRPGSAHHKSVWRYGDRQLDNHNTLLYRLVLRAKFWVLWWWIRFWYVGVLAIALLAIGTS